MHIDIVPDEYGACPRCGAYWGHPDKALDFPNRSKVEDQGVWHWKCYNPGCSAGYYDPETQQVTEDKPTPEQEAASRQSAKEWVDQITEGKRWETVDLGNGVTVSHLVPEEA